MNKGWILKMYLLNDRFILILFKCIKLGFIRTKSNGVSGFSVVFGLYKLELQTNLSLVNNIKVSNGKYETAEA